MLGGMFRRKDKKSKVQEKEVEEAEKTSSEMSRQSPQPKESMESLSNEAAKANPQPHRQTSKLQKSPPAKLSPKSSYTQKESSLTLQKPAEEQQTRNVQGGIIPADAIRTGPSLELQRGPSLRSSASQDLPIGSSLRAKPSLELQTGPNLQTAIIPPEPNRAPPPPVREPSLSLRPVQPESHRQQQQKLDDTPPPLAFQSRELPQEPAYQLDSPPDAARGIFSPSHAGSPITSAPQPKSEQVRQTPQRAPLDDFDSSSAEETAPSTEPVSERPSHEELEREPSTITPTGTNQHPHLVVAQAAQHEGFEPRTSELTSERPRERLSESPVEVLPPHQTDNQYPAALKTTKERTTPHQPPPLVTDTSSPENSSPLSPSESPSLIEAPLAHVEPSDSLRDGNITGTTSHTPASTTPLNASTNTNTNTADRTTLSSTSTTPTWSDASLRMYMDNGDEDIRDLLLVVNDKTGVVPRRDHPVVRGLYKEENEKLDAISSNLDGLLGQYLARKGRQPVR